MTFNPMSTATPTRMSDKNSAGPRATSAIARNAKKTKTPIKKIALPMTRTLSRIAAWLQILEDAR